MRSIVETVSKSQTAKGKRYFILSGYDIPFWDLELNTLNSAEARMLEILLSRISADRLSNNLSFFDSPLALSDINRLLKAEFPEISQKLRINCAFENIVSLGEETDFAVIISLLTSFCHRYGSGEIEFSFDTAENELNLSIKSATKRNVSLSEVLEKEGQWFYYMNLLAEVNLWRFEAEGDQFGLEFTLNMLTSEPGQEFILRERTSLDNIISVVRTAVCCFAFYANNADDVSDNDD